VVESACFSDDEAGRRALSEWVRRHRDATVDVYRLRDPRSARRSVGLHEVLAPGFVKDGLRGES
jgi:hypothetical protein